MPWSLGREDDVITEWERSDGYYATVRVRERGDGGFVARLDVMEQAADESAYERERFDDRGRARPRGGVARGTRHRRLIVGEPPSRLVSATPRSVPFILAGVGDHHDRTYASRLAAGGPSAPQAPRAPRGLAGCSAFDAGGPTGDDTPGNGGPGNGTDDGGSDGGDRPTEASDDGVKTQFRQGLRNTGYIDATIPESVETAWEVPANSGDHSASRGAR